MTTAIGIVITDHIVAGRLEDNRVTNERLRYPTDPDSRSKSTPLPAFPPPTSSICSPARSPSLPSRSPAA